MYVIFGRKADEAQLCIGVLSARGVKRAILLPPLSHAFRTKRLSTSISGNNEPQLPSTPYQLEARG